MPLPDLVGNPAGGDFCGFGAEAGRGNCTFGFVPVCISDLVAMKQTASSVWNGIKTTVVNIASALREAAVSAFQRMVSGIGSALSGLYSVVSNGFSSAIRFITGCRAGVPVGERFHPGADQRDFSMIQSVINTVSGLADRIRSFLHFSLRMRGRWQIMRPGCQTL